MNKILLTILCAMVSMLGFAQSKDYTDNLIVTINGESAVVPNTTVQYLDNGDGTCNFVLKNFVLSNAETTIPVGNIFVPNMPLVKGESYDTFSFKDVIKIEDGDADAVPAGMDMWYGSLLFPEGLFVDLNGKVSPDKAYVTIYIDLSEIMGQIVEVQFGSDFEDSPAGKSYTDNLIVTINGESTVVPNTTVQYLDNGDGTCNFVLKNFVLFNAETTIPVGNIFVPNMPLVKGESYDTFSFKDVIKIEDGDADAVPAGMDMWYGSLLFPEGLFVDLNGKVSPDKAYVTIYIDLSEIMGQIVEVQFGSDFEQGDDDEDGVLGIKPVGQPSFIYDIMGRRVNAATKGMYIIDGKKVVR